MSKIQSNLPKTNLNPAEQQQIQSRAADAAKALVELKDADLELLRGQLPGTPTGFAQALVGGAFDRAVDERFIQNAKVDVLRGRIVNGQSAERLNDTLTDLGARTATFKEALADAKGEPANPLLRKQLTHSLANIAFAADKSPEAFGEWVNKLEALAGRSGMAGKSVQRSIQYGSNLGQLVAAELRTMVVEPLKQDPDIRNRV